MAKVGRPRKEKNLVIINTGRCLLVGPSAREGGAPVRLIPGENDVSSHAWETIQEHTVVKGWLALGMVRSAGEGTAKALDDGLNSLSVADRERKIAASEDVKLLSTWIKDTDDHATQSAIKARVAVLIEQQGGDLTPAPAPDSIPATAEGSA